MQADVSLDRYVVETLMPDLVGHDRRPVAFLIYLYLYACAGASERKSIAISLDMLADECGVSKRAAADAIRHLVKRKLVVRSRDYATALTVYAVARPWKR
ncbi:MAG TPA: helix-turn-helix domain-containing protein [Candidatus Acidoferrum sp.]|nr:helix-turn-helix domain-containing protein [Candidatus Acidoferrum sp.]